jgi:hypothetical protein
MRREYDFSKGTRGKHYAQQLRIVGDTGSGKVRDTAAKIQQVIERDLKGRDDFKMVWRELDQAELKSIREAWLKKISTVLEDHPDRTTARS